MLVKTFCAAVMGLEAQTVTVEVNMARGTMFHLTGLADVPVRESIDRIKAALQNIGFKFPTAEITVNLSPADIKKEGSGYDLPLAVGILAASNKVNGDMLSKYMLVGELGLDGRLQPIRVKQCQLDLPVQRKQCMRNRQIIQVLHRQHLNWMKAFPSCCSS